MTGVLGSVLPSGAVHAALTCVTTSTNETVCEGTSAGFFATFGIVLFIEIAVVVLAIIATVKVIIKAGYSGWWVLIALVPIVGSIFFLIFAFSTWPVTREVEMLRAQVAARLGRPAPQRFGSGSSGSTPPAPVAPTGTDPSTVAMPSFAQFIGNETKSSRSPLDTSPFVTDAPRQEPPAGWYVSPGGSPGQLRYWDGRRWTDHYR